MNVRKMKSQDVEGVFEMSKICFTHPWTYEDLKKEMTNPRALYVVAEVGEELVGYGGLWYVFEEGDIMNVAVSPSYQGQGFGKQIVLELIKQAEAIGVEKLHLEVRESNKVAQSLYKSCSFKMLTVRKRYYQEPVEDAVIMEWMKKE